MTQISFFYRDVIRMLGKNKFRLIYIWLSQVFLGILLYRIERSLFLIFGKYYKVIRIIFIPAINILSSYSNLDINYTADIKGGLLILHPSIGCVISGQSIIGENLTLVGGNIIGVKGGKKRKKFIIGDNCTLGANATIIGPIILGNNINIGANACVTKDFKNNNIVLVGTPAKQL